MLPTRRSAAESRPSAAIRIAERPYWTPNRHSPHVNLFCYLFTLKPNQKGGKISVVGGAGLQLRQGRGGDYLNFQFKTSLKGWHERWFYVSNPSPSLCSYVGCRPVVRNSWTSLP